MTDQELWNAYMSGRAPTRKRRIGCADVLFFVIVGGMLLLGLARMGPELLVTYGLVSVETMTGLLNVEAVPTVAAPAQPPSAPPPSGGRPPAPQPVLVGGPLPDCSTVTDTTTACVWRATPEPPTPTAEPTPTAAGFWTAEELAAFTATAEAFYDPATLPTAPPAFAETVKEGCNDPEKLEQSPLLASWCAPLDE